MREESGYTLAELLVAMSLTLLVAGLAFSSYLFVAKEVQAWRGSLDLENTLHLALRRVSEDLYRADTLLVPSEGAYTIKLPPGDSIVYTLRDSVLSRNLHPMHGTRLYVLSFRITPQAPVRGQRTCLQIELTLTDRQRVLSGTTAVLLRRSAAWQPVPQFIDQQVE